jgi:hypothetical protein
LGIPIEKDWDDKIFQIVLFDRLSVKEEKNTADKWSGSFPFNLLFNRRSVFVVVTSKTVRNPQSPKSHSSLFPI